MDFRFREIVLALDAPYFSVAVVPVPDRYGNASEYEVRGISRDARCP